MTAVLRKQRPVARVFVPLLAPARYKAIRGGRGSGKSHFAAERIIDNAEAWPSMAGEGYRYLCTREVQKTLKESAKALLEGKLRQFGLGEADGFKIYTDRIATPGDGVIIFQGMKDHTAESIKSLEGFHGAWSEEAQTMTTGSLKMLRPTIRWEDRSRGLSSELMFTYNPRLKSDAVDFLFMGEGQRPNNSIVVHANWDSNPYFPHVLNEDRLEDKAKRPQEYPHVWEGAYVTFNSGAYFAEQLADARQSGRIGFVPREDTVEVRAYWDIGVGDATAIWIVQFVGQAIYLLDYYEAEGQPLSAHLNWMRNRGYSDALICLPHDGEAREKLFAIQYAQHVRNAGFRVKTIPNGGKGAAQRRIDRARELFGRCWFNEPTTEAGIDALGWYHEKIDEQRKIGLGPMHDWASHGADAFGAMCMDWTPPYAGQRPESRKPQAGGSSEGKWMG